MATLILSSTDVGAPTLSGTNGTLCSVLDWAVVQNGWAVEFTTTNKRIYRAGTGNRFRLWVQHDSAVSGSAALATIRGAESATSATSVTDAFPTAAQITDANSTVSVSTAASATARAYYIVLGTTFVLMFINRNGDNTQAWDFFFFGDAPPTNSEDSWNSLIVIGNTSTITTSRATPMAGNLIPTAVTSSKVFWCRAVDGSIKSTRGVLAGSSHTSGNPGNFCNNNDMPAMRAGYGNRIYRERVGATCIGGSGTTAGSLALIRRGWIPNLWNALHTTIGSVTSDDTHQDTAYAGSSGGTFRVIPQSTSVACVAELSDTWTAPND